VIDLLKNDGCLDEGLYLQLRMRSHDVEHCNKIMNKLIDDATRMHNTKMNSQRSGGLHVSSVGKCCRAIFLDVAGYDYVDIIPHSPELLRIFSNGHSVHARYDELFNILDKIGTIKLIGIETPLPINKYGIRGTADALIEMNGKKIIVDFKSISEKSFKYMSERQGCAKFDHVAQTLVYCHLFKYDYVMVIYETKGTQSVGSYIYKYDEELAKNCMDKFIYLKGCLNTKVIPKKYSESSFSCKYCRYRNCCHTQSDSVMLACCKKIERWDD